MIFNWIKYIQQFQIKCTKMYFLLSTCIIGYETISQLYYIMGKNAFNDPYKVVAIMQINW